MGTKLFDVWKQIYIYKNMDKMSAFDIAAFIDCKTEEVNSEYNRLKVAGLVEQYKNISDADFNKIREDSKKKSVGRPKKIISTLYENDSPRIEISLEEYARLQWEAGFSAGILHILELK